VEEGPHMGEVEDRDPLRGGELNGLV
jgi:hypothetical protein